jgi:hypothetical protein
MFSWFVLELSPTSLKIRSKSFCCQKIHLICIFFYFTSQTISKTLHFVSYSFVTWTTKWVVVNWSSYVSTRLWYHHNIIFKYTEISGWLLGDLQVIWQVTYITNFEVRLYKACFLVGFILHIKILQFSWNTSYISYFKTWKGIMFIIGH